MIGGLVAVGTFTHGTSSLGLAPLVATVVAWVASPLLGAIASGMIHAMIRSAVHEASSPAAEAYRLQPLLVGLTTSVAAAFLLVSGPAALRITPMLLGAAVSAGVGIAAAFCATAYQKSMRSDHSSELSLPGSNTPSVAGPHEEELAEIKPLAASTASYLASTLSATAGLVSVSQREGRRAASLGHSIEEQPFVPLLVLSALTVAFAHGANDLGNSIGPLAAILVIEQPNGDISRIPPIPLWLSFLGAAGFVAGIALLGSRTIQTVGAKITKLTPSRSFAVQMGTAVAVLSSTVLGLAVSTSHCLVGSLIGIGIAEKLRGGSGAQLNLNMLLKIITGWVVTIPLAMGVSVVAFASLQPSYLADPLCISGV